MTDLQTRDKLKFVCRWGGRWKTPERGQPATFEGGETKLCSLPWPATLPQFVQKLQELTETTIPGSLAIRYQLEDFQSEDDLVALNSEDDLENFKDEFDQITKAAALGSDSKRHLRVYLLPLRRNNLQVGVPVQEKSAADPRSKGHVRFAGERIPVPSSSELPLEPIKAVRVEKPAARNFTAGRTSLKKFFGVRTSHAPEAGDQPLTRMGSSSTKSSPTAGPYTDNLTRQSSESIDDQASPRVPNSPGKGTTGLSTVLLRSPSATGKQRSPAAVSALSVAAGGAQLHDRHSGSPRGSLTPQGSRTLNPSAWGSSGASSPQGAPPTGPARPHGGIGARQGSQGFTEAELGPDAAPTKKRGQSHWVSQIGAAPPGRLRKPSDPVAAEVGAAAAGTAGVGAAAQPAAAPQSPAGSRGSATELTRADSPAVVPGPDAAPKADTLPRRITSSESTDQQMGLQTPYLSAKEEECATEIEAAVNQAWDFKNNLMTTTIDGPSEQPTMVVVPVPADALQPGAVVVLADATAGAIQMGGRRRVQITLPEEGEIAAAPAQQMLPELPPMPPTHLARVAYGSMVAGDWASIALPVELDANGTGAAVVEAPLAPVNLQQVDANDLDKIRELGRGQFGSVWMAKWLGVEVAVKELLGQNTPRARAEMYGEAEMLAALRHPCVIAIYGLVVNQEAPASVIEYVRGGSLKGGLQRLKQHGYAARRVRAAIALQAARGMEYLHSRRVVHFDLKCDNLLCDLRDLHRPVVKIGDLGLSKKKATTFVSGNMRGTLPWMAPELFPNASHLEDDQSEDRVTEKVDIFSFGMCMWEIWTLGDQPYPGLPLHEVFAGIMNGSLRPSRPPDCQDDWMEIMMPCWADEPASRPSFTEIAEALDRLVTVYERGEARLPSMQIGASIMDLRKNSSV
ncbi:hypothetical protein WJX84_008904 [Apatococcus fuscideae]|uniref:Protein kinase domain-containing protein n=1 Tax=Apatococcus fuscideae TaxID=2026836 RepID=A0AAW1TBZ6_9CHLO